MSILWLYDKNINPHAGGTERATDLLMTALFERGISLAGSMVIDQNYPRFIRDANGNLVDDLYSFLIENNIDCVVNQIGYSKWLIEEFLFRGGQRWREEGGRIITCLHFDPLMFSESLTDLLRGWRNKTLYQKVRRFGRILLLPYSRIKARKTLMEAYRFLIEKSDNYVILSESHREKLYKMSQTPFHEKVVAIRNLNTYSTTYPKENLQKKNKTVVIVSRLDEPQKRVSLSLLAWARVMKHGKFNDWKLQIIGDGEYGPDYRELVIREQIPNVEFIGRADPEQYYQNATIYLHTAKREGWGLTISEAMQQGVVPVVMDSSPVFKDLIKHGVNGVFVKNGDIKEFSKCMAELMERTEMRTSMAISAIESSEQCDFDEIIDKWVRLIDNSAVNRSSL